MAQIDGQYEDAKNQQAFLEGRIQEIEKMLEMAQLIDEKAAHSSKEVRVGSTISTSTCESVDWLSERSRHSSGSFLVHSG